MEKRKYIQPEMMIVELSSKDSVMQLVLGSPTGPEPGKSAPKRRVEEVY